MEIDPNKVIARVNGYFQMQALDDSPALRRHLHVRTQQYALLQAMMKDSAGLRVEAFDVSGVHSMGSAVRLAS